MTIEVLNTIIALISGLCGLLATGIPLIITLVNCFKDKKTKEVWGMIMTMADAGMREAEASGKSGKEKKAMVIQIVKAGCAAINVDITEFADQLSAYIDKCIKFANDLNKE